MSKSSDYLLALYDAALSDQHWPRALDLFSREIGSVGAILVALDKVGLPFHIQQATSNYGLDRVQHYFDNYGHFDEPVMSQTLAVTPPFKLLKDKDVWGDMTVIEQRPDYRWGREQMGLRRRAGVRLSSNKGWLDLLALQFDRDWPEIPPTLQEQLNFILPHMAKVVEINRQFSILRERYRAVLAALDHVRIGTCVLSAKGHVIVSNVEARRIFALDDGVGVSRAGHLTGFAPATSEQLAQRVAAIAATACGEGQEHEAVVFAERRSEGRPFMIEIAPLRDSVGEVDRGLEGAIVFIVDPDNQQAVCTRRLALLFALTEAEGDVCSAMVGGHSAAEIAEQRGVSEGTVKTQFKAVYAKTGVRRRADLVRLALAVDPPIGLIGS